MRLSFDIDDTLVLHGFAFPTERGRMPPFIQRLLVEPLREGTRRLMMELRRRGCSIWIYTTSGRQPWEIRLWMFLHGIRIDGIVNDKRHQHELTGRRFRRLPSKYPPAFGIDLHVDDSVGVEMEGKEHGFPVVVIRPDDKRWVEKVLGEVDRALMKHSQSLTPSAEPASL